MAATITLEKRHIGSLEVTLAGVGCNNFGWRIDETQSKRVVDAALDAGINFFDTADIYDRGHSEEEIGRLLEEPKLSS
jgi:aryl-alcohol dehydrogenase-like predicted oxidoreductase